MVAPGGPVLEGQAQTFWYGPNTPVTFSAQLIPFGPIPPPFTAFDHFDGPGVSTRQNPFSVKVTQDGFVTAVYAFLGQAPH